MSTVLIGSNAKALLEKRERMEKARLKRKKLTQSAILSTCSALCIIACLVMLRSSAYTASLLVPPICPPFFYLVFGISLSIIVNTYLLACCYNLPLRKNVRIEFFINIGLHLLWCLIFFLVKSPLFALFVAIWHFAETLILFKISSPHLHKKTHLWWINLIWISYIIIINYAIIILN